MDSVAIDQEILELTNQTKKVSKYNETMHKMSVISKALIFIFVLIIGFTSYSLFLWQNSEGVAQDIKIHLPIHAGEVHYCRMPKQYWDHRIQMIKAMGLNSLSVYVMWNYHEVEKGQFDFQTGDRDLAHFLQLAKKHKMKVLIRPGPYVCAEWDFGGLPARLLDIPSLKIRSSNQLYENQVFIYFSALAPIIKSYLFENGGPIIMLQIQNELGYYSEDVNHTQNLRKMWQRLGIKTSFYYQDSYNSWKTHYWAGAHIGLSGGVNQIEYHYVKIDPLRTNGSLIFGGQTYSGWMTHWGELKWGDKKVVHYERQIRGLVMHNKSFSVYMVFGGTNFGLTAGSNGFMEKVQNYYQYLPLVTSYDYDAPINQQGSPTEKYYKLRQIFQQYYGSTPLPSVPEPIVAIEISSFTPHIKAHLWAEYNKQETISLSKLVPFQSKQLQMYNQGIAIYSTSLEPGFNYQLNIIVHDYAIIFIDEEQLLTINRTSGNSILKFNCSLEQKCILKVLVQAMGHINYGVNQESDKKGLISLTNNDLTELKLQWNVFKVEIANVLSWNKTIKKMQNSMRFPLVLQAQIILEQIGDTYFDMSNYQKGYVWINDHLLGRYWHIGPQQRLFCPSVWLKRGPNKISILELHRQAAQPIKSYKSLK